MANIAVVEDSAATIDMLKTILQSAGHSVVAYTNANSANEQIQMQEPDLILLDIVMPEKNGYEIIRALKRNDKTKHIPVIIISTKSEETDIKWGLRQGAVEYITKPFKSQQIIKAVDKHLAVRA